MRTSSAAAGLWRSKGTENMYVLKRNRADYRAGSDNLINGCVRPPPVA